MDLLVFYLYGKANTCLRRLAYASLSNPSNNMSIGNDNPIFL